MRATLKINMSRTHQTPENFSGKERGTWDSTQAKRESVCVQYDITVHALSILDKRAGPMSHFFAGSVPCAKKVLMPPDSRRPVRSDNRGMAAKEKFRLFFRILRQNGIYIAVGAPTLFVIACVTLILDGKSFLIALQGAFIFVLGLTYIFSLLALGIIFFGNEYSTRRKRRRRK